MRARGGQAPWLITSPAPCVRQHVGHITNLLIIRLVSGTNIVDPDKIQNINISSTSDERDLNRKFLNCWQLR